MHQIVYNLIRKRKWLNDFIVFSKFFTWVRSNIQRIYSNTFLKLYTMSQKCRKKVHFWQDKLTLLSNFPLFWGFCGTILDSFLTWKRSRKAVQKKPTTIFTIYTITFSLTEICRRIYHFFRKPWFSKYYILSHVLMYW